MYVKHVLWKNGILYKYGIILEPHMNMSLGFLEVACTRSLD